MGLIRKTMSVSTLGMVNYRTDRRAAKRNARLARRHGRITSAATTTGAVYQRQQVQLMRQQLQQPQVQQQMTSPPGWYTDQFDGRFVRWFDGRQFTDQVQPR